LHVLNGRLDVSLEVDHVFSIVVVATAARVVWAKLEDNEALGGENRLAILILAKLIVVGLDELALVEFDRVSGDVNLVLIVVVIVQTTSRTDQLGGEGGLGGVLALGGERTGGGGNASKEGEGKSELHFNSLWRRENNVRIRLKGSKIPLIHNAKQIMHSQHRIDIVILCSIVVHCSSIHHHQTILGPNSHSWGRIESSPASLVL